MSGEKKNPVIEGEMIVGFRNLGDFTFYFPLGPKGEFLKIEEESKIYKHGVFFLRISYSDEEVNEL